MFNIDFSDLLAALALVFILEGLIPFLNPESIRKIFLYMASYLISWGLLFGNILGIGFLFLQDKFHLLKLDQSSYYIDHVPVNIDFQHIIVLNTGTLLFCVLFLVLPSYYISKISPVKAVQFN